MSKLEIMEDFISKVKEELNPYKEVFSPLDNHYHCCIEKDEFEPIELQLQANFNQNDVEIMIFPDPRIIEEKNLESVVRFVNAVNSYRINYNLLGSFIVLEDDLDIAFCTSLNYDLIENYDDYFLYSVIKPIDIFCEIFLSLYLLSIGHMTLEFSLQMLDKKWSNISE